MKRFPAQLLFIIFLAGFGVSFGIDQAAKHDGKNPGAVHRSYLPEIKAESTAVIGGYAGNGPAAGTDGSSANGAAALDAGDPWETGSGTEQLYGSDTEASNDGPVKESFMNKLARKLGEVVRIAVGALVGLFVSLASSLLH